MGVTALLENIWNGNATLDILYKLNCFVKKNVNI